MKYSREQTIAAFWSKVDVRGPDECWEWKGGRGGEFSKYGIFSWLGEPRLAHRVAFFLSNGYLSDDKFVCHTCDNPPCCNPSHLFAGTHRENMKDCVRKGRHAHGAKHGRAKLNDEQVAQLRADRGSGLTYVQVAQKYGVSPETARKIVAGLIYKQ